MGDWIVGEVAGGEEEEGVIAIDGGDEPLTFTSEEDPAETTIIDGRARC